MLLDLIFILYGCFILTLIFLKPDWYWNAPRMRRRRALLGDGRTSNLYYFMGGLLLTLGLLGQAGYLGGG